MAATRLKLPKKATVLSQEEFEKLKADYPGHEFSLGRCHLRGDVGAGVWRAVFLGPPTIEGRATNWFVRA